MDLVDASAEHTLGRWLVDRPHHLLVELADSESVWERRVAVLATFAFIKGGDASTSLDLAERLLPDRTDLIQKACGWMLREVGWRIGRNTLTDFLDDHAAAMGRTALSYAPSTSTRRNRPATGPCARDTRRLDAEPVALTVVDPAASPSQGSTIDRSTLRPLPRRTRDRRQRRRNRRLRPQ